VFGRERKKIIPFDHVTSLSMADSLTEIQVCRDALRCDVTRV
jgi:hypothetical protein